MPGSTGVVVDPGQCLDGTVVSEAGHGAAGSFGSRACRSPAGGRLPTRAPGAVTSWL